jgi:hypothetical protein
MVSFTPRYMMDRELGGHQSQPGHSGDDISLQLLVGQLNCCWPLPAQSCLASVSSRSVTKIFILAYTCTCFKWLHIKELNGKDGYILLDMKFNIACFSVF